MTESILDPRKEAFAAALLRSPDNPFKAALTVFGMDTGAALRAANEWIHDIYVISRCAELLEQFGEELFLPNKTALARRVFELAENPATDKKDKIKAYELYANIRGFIEKQTAIANVTNNVTHNRVMMYKDHGTDDDWERKAVQQQGKLIEHSRE